MRHDIMDESTMHEYELERSADFGERFLSSCGRHDASGQWLFAVSAPALSTDRKSVLKADQQIAVGQDDRG